jgi:hypothetical protein
MIDQFSQDLAEQLRGGSARRSGRGASGEGAAGMRHRLGQSRRAQLIGARHDWLPARLVLFPLADDTDTRQVLLPRHE